MNDFLVILAAFLGMYLCSAGFMVAMVRLFFPFRTKEEWEKIDAKQPVSRQRFSALRPGARVVINQSSQLA